MAIGKGFSLSDVVNGAIGNFPGNCMGYMNPGASGSGYIATMKLSVDKVDMTGLDPGAGGIVSYDRCEKDDAYIGQINMGTASSFCGVNGALWGLHLAVAPSIKDGSLEPLFTYPGPSYPPDEKLPAQGIVPVYPVWPLLDAAERLFGRVDKTGDGETDLRRFPPLPGAHVICANKDASGMGPGFYWSAIGIAIADDRETQSNLFIEDCGLDSTSGSYAAAEATLLTHLQSVAKSMVLCGQDQDATYTSIYIGGKFIWTRKDEWGCSLACAPYVVLAEDAVEAFPQPATLLDLTIGEWEDAVGLPPMPPAPADLDVGGIGVRPEQQA
jgi:histidine decarboxylase